MIQRGINGNNSNQLMASFQGIKDLNYFAYRLYVCISHMSS